MLNIGPRISPEGLAFIKRHQGFSALPYQDECHLWVVGYGHLIQQDEAFRAALTLAQADALLLRDIQACQHALTRALYVPLTQNQYDALFSLALSMGPQALTHSALFGYINLQDFDDALALWQAETEMNGVASHGLRLQRQAECALFSEIPGRDIVMAE
jgi:lysozyme